MATIDGKPVGEDRIQAWADEAEAGFSVERVRRGRRPRSESGAAVVTTVRIEPDLLEALRKRAGAEHLDQSQAIRAAIRAWADVA